MTRAPLTLDDARRLVEGRLGGDLVIGHIEERAWGWGFSFVSSDPNDHAVVGVGPILVDRRDGSVHSCSSGQPVQAWADDYERRLARRERAQRVRAMLRRLWPF